MKSLHNFLFFVTMFYTFAIDLCHFSVYSDFSRSIYSASPLRRDVTQGGQKWSSSRKRPLRWHRYDNRFPLTGEKRMLQQRADVPWDREIFNIFPPPAASLSGDKDTPESHPVQ